MSKAKTKTVKKISPTELKTWLDGYCAAHPENWAPTAEQWIIIRDKIFALKDFKSDGDEPSGHNVPQAQHVPVPHIGYGIPLRDPNQVVRRTTSTLGTGTPPPRDPNRPIKTPDLDDSGNGSAFT